MQHLTDPCLTRDLALRCDMASFLLPPPLSATGGKRGIPNADTVTAQLWTLNRTHLTITTSQQLCLNRLKHMMDSGCLNSVTHISICHGSVHAESIGLLSRLPNLQHFRVLDQVDDGGESSKNDDYSSSGDETRTGEANQVLDILDSICQSLSHMNNLLHLDVEFDTVVHGSRLIYLRHLHHLQYLRLRGFDLSDGIGHLHQLSNLQTLHLCHGNFYSAPPKNVHEEDMTKLTKLTEIEHVHLEGFDNLSQRTFQDGLFAQTNNMRQLILKHCQDVDPAFLPHISNMTHLNSLHIINCAFDSTILLESSVLQHLNNLNLHTLSLFYVLEDASRLKVLWGLSNLSTLNVAFDDDVDKEVMDYLRTWIIPTFGRLQTLRIFSEEGMEYSTHGQEGSANVEFEQFNFGDLVDLE